MAKPKKLAAAAAAEFLARQLPEFLSAAFFRAAELKYPVTNSKALEQRLHAPLKVPDRLEFGDELLLVGFNQSDFPLKNRLDALEKLHRNLGPMMNARRRRSPRGGPIDILPSDIYPNGDPISVALRQKLQECFDAINSGLPNAWLAKRRCIIQIAQDGARLVRASQSFSPEPPFDGCSLAGTLGYFQCILATGNARECSARYVRAVHQCRRDRLAHSPIPGLP